MSRRLLERLAESLSHVDGIVRGPSRAAAAAGAPAPLHLTHTGVHR